LELATLSGTATETADAAEMNADLHFAATRRRIRQEIEASAAGKRISEIVAGLLAMP
jgi:hypothetical protein